jgi:hypothetical protein
MPTEEEVIAAGGKIKAAARKIGSALKKFAAGHPGTTGAILGFLAGAITVWVL